MKTELIKKDGRVFEVGEPEIETIYLNPKYELTEEDGILSDNGWLKILSLKPKSGTGPSFVGRWDLLLLTWTAMKSERLIPITSNTPSDRPALTHTYPLLSSNRMLRRSFRLPLALQFTLRSETFWDLHVLLFPQWFVPCKTNLPFSHSSANRNNRSTLWRVSNPPRPAGRERACRLPKFVPK